MEVPVSRAPSVRSGETLFAAFLGACIGCLVVMTLATGAAVWYAIEYDDRRFYFDVAEPMLLGTTVFGATLFLATLILAFFPKKDAAG